MGKIVVNLDVEMAKRKIGLGELAERIGLTQANLSILKTGKAKAIRFSTLEAICRELGCQPGDILAFEEDEEDKENKINSVWNNFQKKLPFFVSIMKSYLLGKI